jgi:hypothetical protein
MGCQRRLQITENSLPLQSLRLHHRQQTLHEATTTLAGAAKGVLPPQHPTSKQALRVVVGRLDPFFNHQLPQPHLHVRKVGAKLCCLGIGATLPRLQQPMQFSYLRIEAKGQLAAVDGAAAEQMPLLQEPMGDPLQLSPQPPRRTATVDPLLKVTLQLDLCPLIQRLCRRGQAGEQQLLEGTLEF